MTNQTYYHISNRRLRNGVQLTSGVYGERVQRPDFIEKNYSKHIQENIFEQIRKSEAPELPSRLNCIFLFPELTIAKAYHATKHKYEAFVYEVEIAEGTPYVFDMDLLTCEGLSFQQITTFAKAYWAQKKHQESQTLEVLLDGVAIVKNVVLQPSDIWDL